MKIGLSSRCAPPRTRARFPSIALAVALALALLAVAGCATVRPWQRERLAHPCMQIDGQPLSEMLESHVRAVRIGDFRASAAGGGGCGCN